MRDRTFEEEFFLVIESKEFNQKTGQKDKRLIAVDDIDEIEHTGGVQFLIHYQDHSARTIKKSEAIKGAIGGLMNKIKKKEQPTREEIEHAKTDRTELFESKHVKSIIETFNNVLSLIDIQERELKMFI